MLLVKEYHGLVVRTFMWYNFRIKVYSFIVLLKFKLCSPTLYSLFLTALIDLKNHVVSRKKEGTIQYGYRKWGTRARVFFQTLAHENSKNEIR